MSDIKDMTIREIETTFVQHLRITRDVNLNRACAIADEIMDYLGDAVGDYLFGERETGLRYAGLKTLVFAVQMAEPDLPTLIRIQYDKSPHEATISYNCPERTYRVRASECEWGGHEEVDWFVDCTREEW